MLELEDHALRFLKGTLHICHPTYLAMRTDPYSDTGRPRENWQRPRDEAKPADDRSGGIALLHIAGLCGAVRLPVESWLELKKEPTESLVPALVHPCGRG